MTLPQETCEACRHVVGMHEDGEGRCRSPGCGCAAFASALERRLGLMRASRLPSVRVMLALVWYADGPAPLVALEALYGLPRLDCTCPEPYGEGRFPHLSRCPAVR